MKNMKKNVVSVIIVCVLLFSSCGLDNSQLETTESAAIETLAETDYSIDDKFVIIRDAFFALKENEEYVNAIDDGVRAQMLVNLLQELATDGIPKYPYPLLQYDSIVIEDNENMYFVRFEIVDDYACMFRISDWDE